MKVNNIPGKVIWFQDAKGIGEVMDLDGNRYYFTYHSIVQASEKTRRSVSDGSEILFSLSKELSLFGRPAVSEMLEMPDKRTAFPLGEKLSRSSTKRPTDA
jgi:hypothetical protein